jgi:hypothetical protein
MAEDPKDEADRLFQEALEAAGARDPREFYRKALRDLRDVDAEAYRKAVAHYEEVLIPAIASGESDPLLAWREYGRQIAEATASGRTMAIDESGRAEPYSSQTPLERLVLHLPDQKKARAILVSLPPTLSTAQRATFELLVRGKQKLPSQSTP